MPSSSRPSRRTSPRCHRRRGCVKQLNIRNPWDLEEAYGALLDYTKAYPFHPEHEDYLVHITTGTHIVQISMFLLVESRHIPGRLVQTSPPQGVRDRAGAGTCTSSTWTCRSTTAGQAVPEGTARGPMFLKAGIERTTRPSTGSSSGSSRWPRSVPRCCSPGPRGREVAAARRIYQLKKTRRHVSGPFVDINCATLRGDGAMSRCSAT